MSLSMGETNNPEEIDVGIDSSVNMAGVLQGLNATLAQLAKASETQAAAFQSLKEDIFLRAESA